MNISIRETHLVSVELKEINAFLYNALLQQNVIDKNIYIWVSHRDDYLSRDIQQLRLFRRFSDERFLYEANLSNNYSSNIIDIAMLYEAYQMWALWITPTKITDGSLFNFSFPKSHTLLSKGDENVIYIWSENIILSSGKSVPKIEQIYKML